MLLPELPSEASQRHLTPKRGRSDIEHTMNNGVDRVGGSLVRLAKQDRPDRGATITGASCVGGAGHRIAGPYAQRRTGAGAASRTVRRGACGHGQRDRVRGHAGTDHFAPHSSLDLAARGRGRSPKRTAPPTGFGRDRPRSVPADAGGGARSADPAARRGGRGPLPGGGSRGDRALAQSPRARSHRQPPPGDRGRGIGRDHVDAARRCRACSQRGADSLGDRRRTLHAAGGERARPSHLRLHTAAPARRARRRALAAGVAP